MLFRHYDFDGLDAQYRLRPKIPDLDDIYVRWKEKSEATRAKHECRIDVPYGDKPLEKLDIFPASTPGAPIHVFIHGGYWQNLDKSSHSFIAEPFLAEDITFIAINYTLAPDASMDEIVQQNRDALAWIGRNAATFNGDMSRLFISGHSAGGHLVAMMMATDWAAEAGLPEDFIKSGCAISGLFDLEPIRLSFVNDKIGMTKEDAQRNSPIYVLPHGRSPVLVAVGADETDEYLRQSSEYFHLLRKNNYEAEYLVFYRQHHFHIIEEFANIGSDLSRKIIEGMPGLARK